MRGSQVEVSVNIRANGNHPIPKLLDGFRPGEIDKLRKLAAARGEPFTDKTVQRLLRNLTKVVPGATRPVHLVPAEAQEMIRSIERDGDYVVITLTDGAVLKTFPSKQIYRNYYYCFRDMVAKTVRQFGPEGYQGANDVSFRYLEGAAKIDRTIRRGMFRPSETASIIECGAYNGWKAVGFSKYVGRKGTLLVLEIDPAQCQLAVENVERNVPDKRTLVINSGVWNTVEEKEYGYEAPASHSLLPPDEHKHFSQKGKIVTDTLDNIIDGSDVEVFDFINIQTGGSELQALQGLDRNLNRVKVIYAGTHYSHEQVSSKFACIKNLLERGCAIYAQGRLVTSMDHISPRARGGMWAVTPAFRDKIVPVHIGTDERSDWPTKATR